MNLIHINIEPTNRCQLNCKYCGDNKTRKVGDMKLNDYRKILFMLDDSVEIRLFLSGEPLLNPEINEFIDLAILFGHPVLIHSNGVALTKNLADKIVSTVKNFPGYLSMSFSLDGATKKEYKTLRGPFLEKVLKNIEYFINLNDKADNPINITIQTIIPFPKPKTVPAYLKKLKGVNFHVRYPHNWDVRKSINDSECEEFKAPCGFLQDSIAIYWNGDCPVCCADLNGRYIIGNIKEGLKSIIKKLDGFKELQNKNKPCPPCELCERYSSYK